MSAPRSSFTSSPPSDVPLDGTLAGPQYHDHFLSLQQSAPLTEDHSTTKDVPLLFDANYPWNTDHIVGHCPAVLESAWANHIQISSGVVPWDPCAMLSNGEFLSSSSTVVNENHGHHLGSVSYLAYEEGHNIAYHNRYAEPNPSTAPRLTSSDRRPPFPVITQEGEIHSFGQPNTWSCHASSSHAPLSYFPYYPYSDPSLPHYSSSRRPLCPTSYHISPGPTPAGPLETASSPRHETHVHRRLSYNPISRRNPTCPSRRGRVTHMIEHDGLRIDERELIEGLTKANGKLTVHPCHWDHAPCNLWITADKSSIKAHIQTWHDGKPGGDKLQVHCSWSGCGKIMSKGSIARHILTIHLEETLECQGCGKKIPRSDVYGRHAAKSVFDACRTLGALVSYSANARVIDARAALESGRKLS